MKPLPFVLLISFVVGCTSTTDQAVDHQLDALPSINERVLNKRAEFLATTEFLPDRTPYDDQPELRQLYLDEYCDIFLKASHLETAPDIPFTVTVAFENEEGRVAHYAWLAGRDAGWAKLRTWLEEAMEEDSRAFREILD